MDVMEGFMDRMGQDPMSVVKTVGIQGKNAGEVGAVAGSPANPTEDPRKVFSGWVKDRLETGAGKAVAKGQPVDENEARAGKLESNQAPERKAGPNGPDGPPIGQSLNITV